MGMLAVACGFGLVMLTLKATMNAPIQSKSANHSAGSLQAQLPSQTAPANQSPSQLVSFHERNRPENVAGSMVVDLDAGQIHVNVQMREPGQYTFWFVTQTNQWISGGPLDRQGGDHYGKVLDIPASDDPIAYTAITLDSFSPATSAGRDVALLSDAVSGLSRRSL